MNRYILLNIFLYIILILIYSFSLGLTAGTKMLLLVTVLCGLSAAAARKNKVDDSGRSGQNKKFINCEYLV